MKEIFTSETFQMLSDRIDTFMEEHDVYDYDNVTIIIEKVADEADPSGYTWKATLMPKDTRNALEDLLVEEHGLIRMFFTEDDIDDRAAALHVDGIIPVYELTKEQIERIKHVLANCDAEYGLSWDAIDGAITDLFDDDSDPDECSESANGKKFLLYWGDDDEPVQYEEGDDPDDFDVFYADSLEGAEEQLRAKISEIRNADPGYYGEGWWSRGDDDGIDLGSPAWDTIDDGMTPEQ